MVDNAKKELIRLIRQQELSRQDVGRLTRLVEAFANADTYQVVKASGFIAKSAFLKSAAGDLLEHHSKCSEAFNKFNFEYMIVRGARAAGLQSRKMGNNERPPVDVLVGDTFISAKTEASSLIKQDSIVISKFQEAAWIRDCQSGADCVRKLNEVVVPKLKNCNKVLMLRAFQETSNLFRYELEEIPLNMLLAIGRLKASDFSAPTPKNTRSAKVEYGGSKPFLLKLDGSVGKITITGMSTKDCVKHAIFRIPISENTNHKGLD